MTAHWKYLKYVLLHKWYVFQECRKYGLLWRGIIHDWHKFLPVEWFPYVDYFYGGEFLPRETFPGDWRDRVKTKESVQRDFDRAWLHHQHKGSHHWQHWVLREDDGGEKCLPMPHECRAEMLADWRGAGRAITGEDNTREWYLRNREKMLLHPDTRRWVEIELGVLSQEEIGARQFTTLKDEPLYPPEWGR